MANSVQLWAAVRNVPRSFGLVFLVTAVFAMLFMGSINLTGAETKKAPDGSEATQELTDPDSSLADEPKLDKRLQLGADCSRDVQCASGYCADGKRCAPQDGTGRNGQYCHHSNHCESGACKCTRNLTRDNNGPSGGGFCPDWENAVFVIGAPRKALICVTSDAGEVGRAGDQCGAGTAGCATGLNCAEGICAPRDGTGAPGAYCHHGNHCQSGSCNCGGTFSTGWCPNWETQASSTRQCAG